VRLVVSFSLSLAKNSRCSEQQIVGRGTCAVHRDDRHLASATRNPRQSLSRQRQTNKHRRFQNRKLTRSATQAYSAMLEDEGDDGEGPASSIQHPTLDAKGEKS